MSNLTYTLEDLLEAAQYGFRYHRDSQNDGQEVPLDNLLQWLMNRKGLLEVPEEFQLKMKQAQETQSQP
jgi:hypothetical protein